MLLPNIHPPVDRSEKTRQVHVKHRGPEQAYRGAVSASDVPCTVCCAAANALPWPVNIGAKAACGLIPGCGC
jgi:hypothetical protein